MKTKLLTLLLLLMATVATQAQTLTDKIWIADVSDDESDVALIMSFEGSECAIIVALEEVDEEEDGMKITMNARLLVQGTYSVNGDQLTLSLDTDNAKSDISFDIEGVDDATRALVKSTMESAIDKEKDNLNNALKAFVPTSTTHTIFSLTDTELVLDGKLAFTVMQ